MPYILKIFHDVQISYETGSLFVPHSSILSYIILYLKLINMQSIRRARNSTSTTTFPASIVLPLKIFIEIEINTFREALFIDSIKKENEIKLSIKWNSLYATNSSRGVPRFKSSSDELKRE